MCKREQENDMFSLLHDKSQENWMCKNEETFDFKRYYKTNKTEFLFFFNQ